MIPEGVLAPSVATLLPSHMLMQLPMLLLLLPLSLLSSACLKDLLSPQTSDLPHGFAWPQLLHAHAFARELHLHLQHGAGSVADLWRRLSLELCVIVKSGDCGCGSDSSRGCAWDWHYGVDRAEPTALLASGVLPLASGHEIASLPGAHHDDGSCAEDAPHQLEWAGTS
eukprot:363913-Chlamydomonas_euryale.AAC.16